MNEARPAAVIVGFTPLERAGLALMLGDHGIEFVGAFDRVVDVDPSTAFDALLVDLGQFSRWPDSADSVAALRADRPHVHVVGVQKGSWHRAATLPDVGMDAMVDLADDTARFIAAIVGAPQPAPVGATAFTHAVDLHDTERAVLELIASGWTSRTIGQRLGLSIHAVESHKQRLFRRIGAQNQAQAVAIGMRLGIIGGAPASGAAS